jgi:CHAT domain-containing protein
MHARSIIEDLRKRQKHSVMPSVSMPTTPGYPDHPLPYPVDEAEAVKALCRSFALNSTTPEATRQNILDSLPRCVIFHFAEHGLIESSGGTRSYLLLSDWNEWPLSMIDLQRLRLQPQSLPFLAYLSAYSSGKTGESALLNESAHFTGFFQRAGFRNVIGSLWSVLDRPCVDVARIVY